MALGKFQMLEPKGWKGMTSKNHLGTVFGAKPQLASVKMHQLLAWHRGKNLELELMKFPTKYFETDDEFIWQLVGSSRRNLPLVEARYQGSLVEAADDNIGQGRTTFELVFEEDWWADGNVIVGEKNELYPIRVLGNPKVEGPTKYVYTCEVTGRAYNGIPGEELIGGKRFSKDFSPVEQELSREQGDIRFASPVSMRNDWTSIRLKHKVAGSQLGRKLAVGMPIVDKNGKEHVVDMWMHHVDFKFEEEFQDEKNHALMYGVSNRDGSGEYYNYGKSGNVIKIGDGIRAQMQYANTQYYSSGRNILKTIESALYSLSAGKLGFGDRRFVLRTGEMGASLFHKAVLNTTSGWMASNYIGSLSLGNPAIVSKTQNKLHDNALSAGFQFVEFRAPNGVVLTVEVDPWYDDKVRNKVYWKTEGLEGPAESFRFDIMYIGTTDEPNIQLAKIKGNEEFRGYQWGPFANPFTGETNNSAASFDEDASVIHKKGTFGVFILDPSRTMSIIPSVLAV